MIKKRNCSRSEPIHTNHERVWRKPKEEFTVNSYSGRNCGRLYIYTCIDTYTHVYIYINI